jgi:DNA polymerase elongation subunit (family B)
MAKPKILLLDIETAPLIIYSWGTFQVNAIKVIQDYYILSCAVKWLGDKKTECKGLKDFPLYKKDIRNDRELVNWIRAKIDEADVVMAHNGDEFDIKKINSRMLLHGMTPPSPSISIDTLKILRSKFGCTSNRLTDICNQLGIGKKTETGGFDLWENVMVGDMKAWKRMIQYNMHDVDLLEGLYIKLRPWFTRHPNMGVFTGSLTCSRCGSDHLMSNGFRFTGGRKYKRLQCQGCGGWMRDFKSIPEEKPLVNI